MSTSQFFPLFAEVEMTVHLLWVCNSETDAIQQWGQPNHSLSLNDPSLPLRHPNIFNLVKQLLMNYRLWLKKQASIKLWNCECHNFAFQTAWFFLELLNFNHRNVNNPQVACSYFLHVLSFLSASCPCIYFSVKVVGDKEETVEAFKKFEE